MPGQVIEWEDARPKLENLVFDKAMNCLYYYPENLGTHITTEEYSHAYALVYTICTQKRPHNYNDKCYEFLSEMATKHAMPEGPKRDMFIRYVRHCFMYVDRFYVARMSLPEITLMMNDVMDECMPSMPIARMHHLKKCFRKWALNEELLGPTHADGGAAKKRARKWWNENVVGEDKCARVEE